jgi:hypothetical protein
MSRPTSSTFLRSRLPATLSSLVRSPSAWIRSSEPALGRASKLPARQRTYVTHDARRTSTRAVVTRRTSSSTGASPPGISHVATAGLAVGHQLPRRVMAMEMKHLRAKQDLILNESKSRLHAVFHMLLPLERFDSIHYLLCCVRNVCQVS